MARISKYLIGGNQSTGGIEDGWFMYSHSSYFRELPDVILKDNLGRNINENGVLTGSKVIENKYFKEFSDKWVDGKNHNLNNTNPSIPILVKPDNVKDWNNYESKPH